MTVTISQVVIFLSFLALFPLALQIFQDTLVRFISQPPIQQILIIHQRPPRPIQECTSKYESYYSVRSDTWWGGVLMMISPLRSHSVLRVNLRCLKNRVSSPKRQKSPFPTVAAQRSILRYFMHLRWMASLPLGLSSAYTSPFCIVLRTRMEHAARDTSSLLVTSHLTFHERQHSVGSHIYF